MQLWSTLKFHESNACIEDYNLKAKIQLKIYCSVIAPKQSFRIYGRIYVITADLGLS